MNAEQTVNNQLCSVCKRENFKYRCPKCNIKTCCLDCVKLHKASEQCDGVRSKTALIYREDMNSLTLSSDYRFLEQIHHKLEKCSLNPLRRSIEKGNSEAIDIPPRMQFLRKQAGKRNTLVTFIPKHFSMHMENTSRFEFKENKIRWHVKWVFPQASVHFKEKNVDEDSTMYELIKKYMEPKSRLCNENSDTPICDKIEKLSYYQSASYGRISVLYKSSLAKFDKRFIRVRLSHSLKKALTGKKVIEYPIFYIVLKDHLTCYINSEDEESETETVSNKSKKKKNDGESSDKKSFNFFTANFEDSDEN